MSDHDLKCPKCGEPRLVHHNYDDRWCWACETEFQGRPCCPPRPVAHRVVHLVAEVGDVAGICGETADHIPLVAGAETRLCSKCFFLAKEGFADPVLSDPPGTMEP